MRQLLPSYAEHADPWDVYRPADPHARLLRLNMVASADGSVTDREGRSGGLGGEPDREVFRTLRALADAILIGAGTVRIEGYGPHRLRADLAERRRAEGRDKPAAVVIVSATLNLDLATPLFTQARTPTVVLTCRASDPRKRATISKVGRVLVAGDEQVHLADGLRLLREELALAHVLCEGGPHLNAGLLAGGLVDELCLTIAPQLMGPTGPSIVTALDAPLDLQVLTACEAGGELLLRYRVGVAGA